MATDRSTAGLAAFLLKRAFAPRLDRAADPHVSAPALSRRAFLGSTGGVATAVFGAAVDPFTPLVVKRGRVVTIFFGGQSWSIDGSRFGAAAHISWVRQRNGF